MEFFNSAIEVLQTLVVALGAGLGVWGGGFAPCVPIQLEGFDGAGYELQDVTLRRIALAGGGTVQLARCKGVSLEDVRTV